MHRIEIAHVRQELKMSTQQFHSVYLPSPALIEAICIIKLQTRFSLLCWSQCLLTRATSHSWKTKLVTVALFYPTMSMSILPIFSHTSQILLKKSWLLSVLIPDYYERSIRDRMRHRHEIMMWDKIKKKRSCKTVTKITSLKRHSSLILLQYSPINWTFLLSCEAICLLMPANLLDTLSCSHFHNFLSIWDTPCQFTLIITDQLRSMENILQTAQKKTNTHTMTSGSDFKWNVWTTKFTSICFQERIIDELVDCFCLLLLNILKNLRYCLIK